MQARINLAIQESQELVKGPPGPPPRPGLWWNEGTKRWRSRGKPEDEGYTWNEDTRQYEHPTLDMTPATLAERDRRLKRLRRERDRAVQARAAKPKKEVVEEKPAEFQPPLMGPRGNRANVGLVHRPFTPPRTRQWKPMV